MLKWRYMSHNIVPAYQFGSGLDVVIRLILLKMLLSAFPHVN